MNLDNYDKDTVNKSDSSIKSEIFCIQFNYINDLHQRGIIIYEIIDYLGYETAKKKAAKVFLEDYKKLRKTKIEKKEIIIKKSLKNLN